MALLILTVSVSGGDTTGWWDPADVCLVAYGDAERSVDRRMWLAAGAIASLATGITGGPAVVVLAYLNNARVPLTKWKELESKSPEYRMVYSRCYEDKIREIRVKSSAVGCAVGSLLFPLVYLIGISPFLIVY